MTLNEVGWEGVLSIHLANDRYKWYAFVDMIMKLWVS